MKDPKFILFMAKRFTTKNPSAMQKTSDKISMINKVSPDVKELVLGNL